jgi:hypothetical protein
MRQDLTTYVKCSLKARQTDTVETFTGVRGDGGCPCQSEEVHKRQVRGEDGGEQHVYGMTIGFRLSRHGVTARWSMILWMWP